MQTLTLSPSAIARIKFLMTKDPSVLGLRVGVAVKGCSGYIHTLDYAHTEHEEDEKISAHGVTVYVEKKALPIIFGTELIWQEEDLDARFVFKNPNATGTCGCGESFTVNAAT